MKKEFLVEENEKFKRLDLFLKERLPFSRKKISNLIKSGNVFIEGKKVKPSLILKGGEKVIVEFNENEATELIPLPVVPDPKILFEDENYLAIDKPSGIIVHPNLKNLNQPTISSWLIYKWPELKKVGEDPLRPGIVHRLDKETSGVLLVCKTNEAFFHLKEQFQKRLVKKEYLALVLGEIKKDKGIIDFPLSYSRKSPFKRKIVLKGKENKKAKPALTSFKVIKRFKGFTFLKLFPHTGRTHQIRVHLSSLGFPIVGDTKYGFKKAKLPFSVPRLFLHAFKISFKTIDGKFLEIESPLSDDLERVLNSLPSLNKEL